MGWGKLNVYNIGQSGINVDSDPVHLEPGECTKLQNMILDPVGVLGGIRKRDGLTKVNSSAMAGAVKGFIGLPLPDLTKRIRTFYAALENTSVQPGWRTSTDGTTWTNNSSVTMYWQAGKDSTQETGVMGPAHTAKKAQGHQFLDGIVRVIFPGDDYTPGPSASNTQPTVHVWDGTNDYIVANIPDNPNSADNTGVRDLCSLIPYDPTHILLCTHDDSSGTHRGRVLLVDITSGATTQIGPNTDLNTGHPHAICIFRNQIWIGGFNGTGGSTTTVRHARTTETTWVTDFTTGALNGYTTDIIPFKGNLSAAFACDAGGVGKIYQRTTADGVWTNVDNTDGTNGGAYEGPFIISKDGNTIFAFWNSSNGTAPITRIRKSTDGVTWSDEVDLTQASLLNSTSQASSGYPFRDSNGDIYWPVTMGSYSSSKMLKRTNAGTWSVVDTLASQPVLRGPLGILYI